jgi:hypothetical protein
VSADRCNAWIFEVNSALQRSAVQQNASANQRNTSDLSSARAFCCPRGREFFRPEGFHRLNQNAGEADNDRPARLQNILAPVEISDVFRLAQ